MIETNKQRLDAVKHPKEYDGRKERPCNSL